jgi:hypothetical protein
MIFIAFLLPQMLPVAPPDGGDSLENQTEI